MLRSIKWVVVIGFGYLVGELFRIIAWDLDLPTKIWNLLCRLGLVERTIY